MKNDEPPGWPRHVGAALAERIEQASGGFIISLLEGARALPWNPLGIETRQFGRSRAYVAAGWPDWAHGNRLYGPLPDGAGAREELLAFFAHRRRPLQFDATPASVDPAAMRDLAGRGFAQTGFEMVLYGPAHAGGEPYADGITVAPVDEASAEAYLRILGEGFGFDAEMQRALGDLPPFWLRLPGHRLFLARVDGVPAGAAALYIHDGIGYLAVAATSTAHRGRGCQTALIHHRIRAAAGCDLVSAQTAFASGSQRNMERAGLRVAYSKAIWDNRR